MMNRKIDLNALTLGIFQMMDAFRQSRDSSLKTEKFKKNALKDKVSNFLKLMVVPNARRLEEQFGLSSEEYRDVILALKELKKTQPAYKEENFHSQFTSALADIKREMDDSQKNALHVAETFINDVFDLDFKEKIDKKIKAEEAERQRLENERRSRPIPKTEQKSVISEAEETLTTLIEEQSRMEAIDAEHKKIYGDYKKQYDALIKLIGPANNKESCEIHKNFLTEVTQINQSYLSALKEKDSAQTAWSNAIDKFNKALNVLKNAKSPIVGQREDLINTMENVKEKQEALLHTVIEAKSSLIDEDKGAFKKIQVKSDEFNHQINDVLATVLKKIDAEINKRTWFFSTKSDKEAALNELKARLISAALDPRKESVTLRSVVSSWAVEHKDAIDRARKNEFISFDMEYKQKTKENFEGRTGTRKFVDSLMKGPMADESIVKVMSGPSIEPK